MHYEKRLLSNPYGEMNLNNMRSVSHNDRTVNNGIN